MQRKFIFILLISLQFCFGLYAGNRIIFVGDSITFQGSTSGNGWGRIIQEAVSKTETGNPDDFVFLGGCGQSVGSWNSVCKRALTRDFDMGDKRYKVKSELEKGTDTLVIMLGMNDIIGPYVGDSEESIDKWLGRYEKLIDTLKERSKPKTVALATITMYTEDELSPKKQLMDKLNERLAEYTKAKGYKLLPTAENYARLLQKGRTLRPDFHITGDYVHPSSYGHIAIAKGMLTGLGFGKAAQYVQDNKVSKIDTIAKNKTGISWELIPGQNQKPDALLTYTIKVYPYNLKSEPVIKANVPSGWQVKPAQITGTGEFTVTGTPSELTTIITLATNNSITADVNIHMPWLVCADIRQPRWLYKKPLDVEKTKNNIDAAISEGKDFLQIAPNEKSGIPQWKVYFPSFKYTGGDDPDSVDFAQLTVERNFDAGYGVRWIKSETDQDINILVKSRIFAGNVHMQVWLNSDRVYNDEITKVKGRKATVPAKLKKGWNIHVFKSNHRAWLWQNSVGIVGRDGKHVSGLTYAITPQK